jgi:hypothetical protein
MSEAWSSQDDDDLGDLHAWIARRNARLALQPKAIGVARDLWNQATQSGDDLYAGNPSDLTAIGLAALGGATARLTTANVDTQNGGLAYPSPATGGGRNSSASADDGGSQGPLSASQNPANAPWVSQLDVVGPPPEQPSTPSFLNSLNHNPIARVAGGLAGYAIGLPAGVARGGWHALEGVGDGLNFARSLFFPEGLAKAWNEAQAATHGALQYGRGVAADPSRLVRDAVSGGMAAVQSVVPTSIADTALGEFGHELGLGMNAGETAANVAGFFAAPEVVGGLNAARTFAATRDANILEMTERGLNEPTAKYLSKAYKGQGDHALVQKSQKSVLGFETPLLEGAQIPKWLMDGPLNVSKPRGLSQYDFYKYHYGVDPNYYGGSLPPGLNGGKGLSGNLLGFERYSNPGRTWARIPYPWKDYVAGVTSGDVLRQPPQTSAGAPQ